MRVLELPDMLRKYKVEPVIVDGFATRGNEFPSRPDGALRHWTVGGMSATSSLRVVTYGRGQPNPLAGPLCAILQSRESSSRDDKAYCVASGKANHAGDGLWNGIRGNYKLLGLEIEWQGPNESFSGRRKDVSERIMRALLDCCVGESTDDVAEHREYALPRGRKQDTNLSGDELRRRMREIRPDNSTGGFLMALTDAEQKEILAFARKPVPRSSVVRKAGTSGMTSVSLAQGHTRHPIPTQALADLYKYLCGQKEALALRADWFDDLVVVE